MAEREVTGRAVIGLVIITILLSIRGLISLETEVEGKVTVPGQKASSIPDRPEWTRRPNQCRPELTPTVEELTITVKIDSCPVNLISRRAT